MTLQLFEVTPDGAKPLTLPRTGADVNEMFDDLPLGIYEGIRTFEHVRFLGLSEQPYNGPLCGVLTIGLLADASARGVPLHRLAAAGGVALAAAWAATRSRSS